jgi:hypothetical protein
LQNAIRGQVDRCHAVLPVEKADDVDQFLTHEGFTPGKQEAVKTGHGRRDGANLLHGQITLLIQVIPVEAKVAFGIATRGDKEDEEVEMALA